jgi:DMSO/TMAO reductase YedYZ molybdopterin-dependent catalytic subunit
MTVTDRASSWNPLRRIGRMTSRQVDLLLGVCTVIVVVTGVTAWAVGTGWSRVFVVVHAVAGIGFAVLAPMKMRGSVRTGLKRGHLSRWLSILLGVLVVATVALGLLHSSGAWYGVGYWSALWTHTLVATGVLVLVVWHVTSRPARPRRTDLDRRALLGGLSVAIVAGATYTTLEGAVRVAGLDGAARRFTGSHERGSFDPDAMPTVQWIDDSAPQTPEDEWRLLIDGRVASLDDLRNRTRTVEADLDCTGGWWSRQAWDVVPLSELLPDLTTRSIKVTSSTGYSRLFPATDAATTYLAVGYGGDALRRGHGAPVRLVAPGRRGPWWVKWVVGVEPDDRPWWAQFPFPLT